MRADVCPASHRKTNLDAGTGTHVGRWSCGNKVVGEVGNAWIVADQCDARVLIVERFDQIEEYRQGGEINVLVRRDGRIRHVERHGHRLRRFQRTLRGAGDDSIERDALCFQPLAEFRGVFPPALVERAIKVGQRLIPAGLGVADEGQGSASRVHGAFQCHD